MILRIRNKVSIHSKLSIQCGLKINCENCKYMTADADLICLKLVKFKLSKVLHQPHGLMSHFYPYIYIYRVRAHTPSNIKNIIVTIRKTCYKNL